MISSAADTNTLINLGLSKASLLLTHPAVPHWRPRRFACGAMAEGNERCVWVGILELGDVAKKYVSLATIYAAVKVVFHLEESIYFTLFRN
jgi:hypothetical protein